MFSQLRQAFLLRVFLGLIGISCVFSLAISIFVISQAYFKTVDLAKGEASKAMDAIGGASAITDTATGKPAALAIKLEEFVRTRSKPNRNHFVIARVYGPNRQAVTTAEAPGNAFAVAGVNRVPERFPDPGKDWTDVRILGNQVYVHVVVPVMGAGGAVAGYFEGVFNLSHKFLSTIYRAVWDLIQKTIIISVAAAVASAQFLYPILKDQHGKLIEAALKLLNENILSLKLLGNAVAKRDSDTHIHNFRVTISSIRLAEALSRTKEEIQDLIKGAFLHDVGKIGIPDAILLKQGKLTDREFREMRRHVIYGAEIIEVSEWLKGANDVVQHHHERFDGKGYPKGFKGKNIPMNARIFAVVDVFDALTSRRPYKEPFPFDEAERIIEEGRGGHFDPDVLDAFNGISGAVFADINRWDEDAIEAHLDEQISRYFGV